MRNGRGDTLPFLGEGCGPLGDFCGRPGVPRRHADDALKVMADLALVGEPGLHGDLRQGEVAGSL